MQSLNKIVCVNCVHLESNGFELFCNAFPNGIPEIILLGKNDHSRPLPDQGNDIVFEPKNDNS